MSALREGLSIRYFIVYVWLLRVMHPHVPEEKQSKISSLPIPLSVVLGIQPGAPLDLDILREGVPNVEIQALPIPLF